MGVPITTEAVGDGSDVGYRVKPEDYYLPDLGLTVEETAALRVAVSAVSLGSPAGEGALMKLGGVGDDAIAPIASLPIAPALATLFEAFRHRAVVTFMHRGRTRSIEPWGLSSKRGHWYVVGFDRERKAIRAFRADRIDGVTAGPPEQFEAPADFRPGDHVEARPWMLGDEPAVTVRIAVDDAFVDTVLAELGGDAIVVDRPGNGATHIELVLTNRATFRAVLLGFLEHAEVVDPPDVRAELIAWLAGIAKGPNA
jgi:proteasome accessory factor B